MALGDFGNVLSGNRPIRVQAELKQQDMLMFAGYLLGAFFLATLLSGFIVRSSVPPLKG